MLLGLLFFHMLNPHLYRLVSFVPHCWLLLSAVFLKHFLYLLSGQSLFVNLPPHPSEQWSETQFSPFSPSPCHLLSPSHWSSSKSIRCWLSHLYFQSWPSSWSLADRPPWPIIWNLSVTDVLWNVFFFWFYKSTCIYCILQNIPSKVCGSTQYSNALILL